MAGVFFNNDKFKKDLMEWSGKSKLIIANEINNFLGDVALTASSSKYTKEASAGAIDQLGSRVEVSSGKYQKVSDESGKTKRVRVGVSSKWKTSPDVGTFKLANWIMKNQGLPPLGKTKTGIPGRGFRGQMQKSGKAGKIGQIARNLIAARKLSIGFIRKGWWAAANALGKKVMSADKIALSRFGGGQKVVENAGTFRASIYNNAGAYDIRYFPERKRNPVGAKAIGEEGLTRAISEVIGRFYKRMEQGLRKEWRSGG